MTRPAPKGIRSSWLLAATQDSSGLTAVSQQPHLRGAIMKEMNQKMDIALWAYRVENSARKPAND